MQAARSSAICLCERKNAARSARVATGELRAASGKFTESLVCSIRRDPIHSQVAAWKGDFPCAIIPRPP